MSQTRTSRENTVVEEGKYWDPHAVEGHLEKGKTWERMQIRDDCGNMFKSKFGDIDFTDKHTEYYRFNGVLQSKRKSEAWEIAKRITKERGIPNYNPDLHLHGVQMGQRMLQTYKITGLEREWAGAEDTPAHPGWVPGTGIYGIEMDDVNYENNVAMQQSRDDISRTAINGMNISHETIERRFGKEVTPETINTYMEMLNHNLGAGALIQEHVTETNPELVKDCYAIMFTGDDDVADAIDPRFITNIDTHFPEYQVPQLKEQLKGKMYQVCRIPTMALRTSDGGLARAWVGQQASLAYVGAYDIPAGDAVTSDFVFTIKHGDVVFSGTALPYRRAQRVNSIGGVPYGYYADICQSSRTPEAVKGLDGGIDPVKVTVEALTPGCVLTDQGWLHNYLAGGSSSWASYVMSVYTDEILEDPSYYGADWGIHHYKCGVGEVPNTLENGMQIAEAVGQHFLASYDLYPAMCEAHFGGSQRFLLQCAAIGAATGCLTGDTDLGQTMWMYNTHIQKEHCMRLGFYGHDMQDQMGCGHNASYRSDQSCPYELRNMNFPDQAMHVGHVGGYIGICGGSAHARGAAYCTNPVIKVAYADHEHIQFDWRYPRREYGRGALHDFMPAGERTVVCPSYAGGITANIPPMYEKKR